MSTISINECSNKLTSPSITHQSVVTVLNLTPRGVTLGIVLSKITYA